MSSKGGYAAAAASHGGDRFYSSPEVRRQQQQQMMQSQLHRQQQHRQLQAAKPESYTGDDAEVAEKRGEDDDSLRTAALCIPPSVSSASVLKVTNLDRLVESVTPFIQAQNLSEPNSRGWRTQEVDSHSFFCLEDLWESFNEWSVCGAGVPLILNEKVPVEQYYVPFLSGMQLYIDPSKPSSGFRLPTIAGSNSEADRRAKSILNLNMQQLNGLSLGDQSVSNSAGGTVFQFLEHEQPYYRRPLTDKISALVSQFPDLVKCRSCDLLPTSWICVAWYPIYRIPIGPTLRDLDACFLTFHSLSTQSRSNVPPQFHPGNTRTVRGFVDPTPKISLPVFGLASYKLKGSIVSPCGPQECELENSLLQSAESWLRQLEVILPDYQFFRAHSSH